MKIIQVMPEFGLAGAEVMVENLAYGLKSEGHDVLIISFYSMHTTITNRLEQNGINIEYLGKKKGLDLSIIFKMRKILKKFKPNVVHTHRYVLPYAFLASIGLNVKRVHTVHNIAEKEVPPKQLPMQKVLFKNFGVIPVAITPITKKSIEDYYGLNSKEVLLVYNGIDLRQCIAKNNTQIVSPVNILHVGRFAPQKNHEMMIDAFVNVVKDYPNCELDLVGDGDLVDNIKKKVTELGIQDKVHFVGLLDNVYEKMSKSDIFILPSKYEGMPITLIESMATGLPIVATAVGGIPDMIENGISGILIGLSKEELTNAIITLIDNSTLRENFSREAKKRALQFSLKNMTEAYIKIYKS